MGGGEQTRTADVHVAKVAGAVSGVPWRTIRAGRQHVQALPHDDERRRSRDGRGMSGPAKNVRDAELRDPSLPSSATPFGTHRRRMQPRLHPAGCSRAYERLVTSPRRLDRPSRRSRRG
jgi:hypothetical protein